MIHKLLLACAIFLGTTPFALAQGPGPETQISDTLDGSVRWLRSQQDRATGAYGDQETTALVLVALGESPRKYREADGFFVRGALEHLLESQGEEGAFHGADGKPNATLTALAVRALFSHQNPERKSAYANALAWIGKQAPATDPFDAWIGPTLEKDAALKHVRSLLARRGQDGSWPADEGAQVSALKATALAVIDLARYVKTFQPAKGPEAPIVPLGPFTAADKDRVIESMNRGAAFLVSAAEDGKFGAPGHPDAGLTSMVIGALQGMPMPRDEKVQKIIDDGLEWLVSLQKPDGSIHQGMLANYVTSSAVMALAKSDKPAHKAAVKKAQAFLIGLQADEGEGYSEGDRYYGGIGYGGDERPDLSNLQMALEALAASGLEKDHEAYQRAIKFLERCQNRSESNDVRIDEGGVITTSGNDGGSAYMPGDSKAGYVDLDNGERVPRSYGSMTYALLKSYVLAGLSKEDPRVKAAFSWLEKNYTLDVNPGFDTSRDARAAYQGIFYYFLAMSRALNTYGCEELTDSEGVQHAWKRELAGRLIAMQSKESGAWSNRNAPRWWEGNPILGTAYALSTLAETLE
ncbi:MAG: hypothetical protein KDB61_02120 [Planctomycetes bacterium]|nr:hypothetical protein [Planctomycetota bacterium]